MLALSVLQTRDAYIVDVFWVAAEVTRANRDMISMLFFLRHFQGLCLSELRSSMNTHLHNLLLNEQKDCSPSEWSQQGLFSLCYSLLFR